MFEARASGGVAEQWLRRIERLCQTDRRHRSRQIEAFLAEPTEHLIDGVTRLVWMRVLIEVPGAQLLVRLRHLAHDIVDLARIRLGEAEEDPSQRRRDAAEAIVEPDDGVAARTQQLADRMEGGARVARRHQDALGNHQVEALRLQRQVEEIAVDEIAVAQTVSLLEAARELERRARHVDADHRTAADGQERAELARATADLEHARAERNLAV